MNKKIRAAMFGVALLLAWAESVEAAEPAVPVTPSASAGKPATIEMDPKVLVENNNLGKCLACHAVMKHPEMVAGNIGPPFIEMKARFPDASRLRAIIYDEQANNPDTIMPPFGRNKVLTKEQIDAIANYILQF